MIPLTIKKTVLQAKIEATYGTYEAPGASDVMWVQNLDIQPLQGQRLSDDVMCAKLGAKPSVLTGEHVTVKFDFSFRGAGAAGDLPNYHTVMRAGGRSFAQSVGTSVAYSLVSDSYESASLAVHYDGNLHKVAGVRGVITHSGSNGEKPVFTFTGLGLYMPVEASTAPTLDCSGLAAAPPIPLNSKGAFSFFGQTPPLQSWSTDFGAAAVYEESINLIEIVTDDRNMSANLQFKANKVDEHDYFSGVRASDKGVTNIQIGNVAGHIVEVQWPEFELNSISYAERNAHYDYSIGGALLPGAGDLDEIIVIR